MPLAAIYLDRQISEGTITVAITGRPGFHHEIPLEELAARLSTPKTLQELREKHPEAQLRGSDELMTADAAAWHIHELHTHGYLVMDDNHVLNVAIPPKTADGKWVLTVTS